MSRILSALTLASFLACAQLAPARAQDDPEPRLAEAQARRDLIERRLQELIERAREAKRRGDREEAERLGAEVGRLQEKLAHMKGEADPLERRVELRTLLAQIEARLEEARAQGRERQVDRLEREREQIRGKLAEMGDRGPFAGPPPMEPSRVEHAEQGLRAEAAELQAAARRAREAGRVDESEKLTRRLDEVHGQLELLAAARQRDEGERRRERRDAERARRDAERSREREGRAAEREGREAERPADDLERLAREHLARVERDLRQKVAEETHRIRAEAEERIRQVETEARRALEQAHENVRRRVAHARGEQQQERERAERERTDRKREGAGRDGRPAGDLERALREQTERVERLEREMREMRRMLEEALRRR